ncbi:hypothetical protein ACH4CE_29750 [Streptomyces gelaticus]|uniref:hypothetical protein n=1 Tax=Streptomyces gelaticus TaxID=285446 RepID=UPI0037A29473
MVRTKWSNRAPYPVFRWFGIRAAPAAVPGRLVTALRDLARQATHRARSPLDEAAGGTATEMITS